MPLPRLLATSLWLVVTMASTAMVWAATSIVAADVTDRPAPVLAHQDVVTELESGSSAAGTPPTSPPPTADSPTSTLPSPGRGSAPAGPNAPAPTAPASQSPPPGVTVAPAPPATTPTTRPGAPPPTRPASPPTTQPQRPTATYSTAGGVVRVACNGVFIELLSAIPTNGYAVDVVAGGPANVDVRFVRGGQTLSVKAVCFGQPIRYYEQNPPRQAPGRF